MHPDHAADSRVIVNDDVSGKLREIAHRYTVPDTAVVSNVPVGEQQAVIADGGYFFFAGCPLHAHVLAQHGAAADRRVRAFAFILTVLRGAADRGKWIDLTV